MLSPDDPTSRLVLAVVLAAVLAALVLRAVLRDRSLYRRFRRYRSTARRQRAYRRWLLDSFVTFGLGSLVVLVVAAPWVPLLVQQIERIGWVGSARDAFDRLGALGPSLVVAAIVVLVGGTVVAVVLARNSTDAIPTVGDIGALLPRNRRELVWTSALSINAGVVEELMFRLALPALIFGVTESVAVSVIGSLVIFGGLHAYQGLPGVLGSMIIGAALLALYIASGSILAPIVAHALIDLRSLALIPVVVQRVHRVRA